MLSPEALTGLADGAKAYREAFARGLEPDPVITISEWAEQYRVVPSESSPKPGKWSNDLVPFLREIMDCLSPQHPCEEVDFSKSSQVAGTEGGVNFFGAVAHLFPGPMGIYLPSIDLLNRYNTQKLDPTIQKTPILRKRVAEQKSRDEKGSTTLVKKFPGGLAILATSSSSAALKSASFKYLIKDELSEWPSTLEDAGDPDDMADKRTTAFIGRGRKIFNVSTPSIKGSCRITAKFYAGDQRRFYVPCPHCGGEQVLDFKNLKYNDKPPYNAQYACAHCGVLIDHRYKRQMVAEGHWIAEAKGEGRHPSFHINQLYSPFVPWDKTVEEYFNAKGKPEKEKVFTQQVLGEPYEEKGEAPDYEKLFERVEPYKLGGVPPQGLFITGAADVQGNRLEFMVKAWGEGFTSWLIDKGVIEGDPFEPHVWQKLSAVIDRKYHDAWGNTRTIDAFGIDTGYASNQVYQYVRKHAHKERVFALDGRGGPKDALHPPIGTPKKKDVNIEGQRVGTVMLWPVGTWPMKSEHYAALRKLIAGPDADGTYPQGTPHYPDSCDRDFFKQETAEYLGETDKRNGYVTRAWKKISGQANEALDLEVYCRALAHRELDPLTDQDWERLRGLRAAGPMENTLFTWAGAPTASPAPAEEAKQAGEPAAAEVPQETEKQEAPATPFVQPRDNWLGGRTSNWLGR